MHRRLDTGAAAAAAAAAAAMVSDQLVDRGPCYCTVAFRDQYRGRINHFQNFKASAEKEKQRRQVTNLDIGFQ
jgi:cyanophycinase-like exopeptidase